MGRCRILFCAARSASLGPHTLLQHIAVKIFHQLRGCFVVDLPQTRYNARGARIHEPTSNTQQSFAANILAECCLACTQYHQ